VSVSGAALLRRQTSGAMATTNSRKMFDESQMVRRVRAYLASVKSSIVTDEALLSEKSAHCEPPAVLPPQQPGSFCPALVSLHWLRVPERISFKVAVLIIHAVPPRPTYSRV